MVQSSATPQDVAHTAMKVQGRLLEAAVAAGGGPPFRKGLTKALDRAVVEIVRAIAPPLVLEVGAHQAWFSSQVKAALPGSRVLAFEANPEVHAWHRDRLAAGGVEYVHRAVSDRPGAVTLAVPTKADMGESKTMGSLLHHVDAVSEQAFEVEAVRLDDFLGDEAGRIKVMWIDVEGAIAMVLGGAERALSACELVYAEVEPYQVWAGQMIDAEVFAHLARFGLVPVLRDVQRRRRGYNVLFLRRDRLEDEAVRAAVDRFAATVAARPPAGEAVERQPRERRQGRRAPQAGPRQA